MQAMENLFILLLLFLYVRKGYDGRGGRYYEEEDSACPALLEREFHSIHRNVPGLRRAGVDANAIRQVIAKDNMHFFYFLTNNKQTKQQCLFKTKMVSIK